MQRLNQIVLRMIAMATLACAMAACSSDLSLSGVTLVPKPETLLRKPDWATFSGGKNEFELRPVTAADLVSSEGQCDGGAGQAAAEPVAGGIALQMTECDVVRRAGAPEQLQIGDERGERATVITYTQGPRPGIYRFSAGRLTSIERAPDAPGARAAPKAKSSKKAARS